MASISRTHAQVIARAATAERIDAIAEVEAALVLAAESVAPKQLRDVVQHVTDAIDGDGGAAAGHARGTSDGDCTCRRRSTAWSRSTVCSTPRVARSCCRPSTVRWPAGGGTDRCSRAQRRADASGRAVPGRREGSRGGAWPPASAACDDRRGSRGARAEPRARGAREPRHAAHVGRLPVATIQRLLCDAGVARVITQGSIGADRRRPDDAHDPIRVVASAGRAGWRMRCTGLRSTTWAGARSTIGSPGRMGAAPTSRIANCGAGDIITRCTRARWRA